MTHPSLILGVTGSLMASTALSQASFLTLGTFANGGNTSHPTSISRDGSTVVGLAGTGGLASSGAFRWTADIGLQELPTVPDGTNFVGGGVSQTGRYITGSYSQNNGQGAMGFVWSETTGSVSVGALPGGKFTTRVGFITDDGLAVGVSAVGFTKFGANLFRAVKWTPQGGLQALPLPSPGDEQEQSNAFRVLPDGRIIGRSASGTWLYSESTGFEMLPNADGMFYANDDATFMAGETLRLGPRATYWTPQTGPIELPTLIPDELSSVRGMNADGSVIIGEVASAGYVVWLDQGMPIPLIDYAESFGIDMDGWTLLSVQDVSADGTRFVGSARHSSWEGGRVEAYVLTIPAPGSIALLGLGCMVIRRRR
ncbi:MAG TPA: hypothetical protein ENJ00_08170 [Phycisphaerales bacterium]|nr:hypothetical protein [Phycisphaerales bacterium]